jgi:hypothetical protein
MSFCRSHKPKVYLDRTLQVMLVDEVHEKACLGTESREYLVHCYSRAASPKAPPDLIKSWQIRAAKHKGRHPQSRRNGNSARLKPLNLQAEPAYSPTPLFHILQYCTCFVYGDRRVQPHFDLINPSLLHHPSRNSTSTKKAPQPIPSSNLETLANDQKDWG